MSTFLSLAYWFNARPEPLSGNGRKALIEISAALLLLGIILATGVLQKKLNLSKKIQYFLTWFFLSNAFIGLALLFFNYELTPLLRSRFWYLLWAIAAIVWIIQLLRFYSNNKRRAVTHSGREQEIKKYLPS